MGKNGSPQVYSLQMLIFEHLISPISIRSPLRNRRGWPWPLSTNRVVETQPSRANVYFKPRRSWTDPNVNRTRPPTSHQSKMPGQRHYLHPPFLPLSNPTLASGLLSWRMHSPVVAWQQRSTTPGL